MSQKVILFLVVAIVAVGGGYFLLSQKPVTNVTNQESNTEVQTATSDGKYVNYSSGLLSQATTKRRVLFFYASWCPTCRPADAAFKANEAKIPDDVTLIRVNYNDSDTDQEEKDLANKYNVTYQHTYVQIDASGQEITKWNGGQIAELLSNLK